MENRTSYLQTQNIDFGSYYPPFFNFFWILKSDFNFINIYKNTHLIKFPFNPLNLQLI